MLEIIANRKVFLLNIFDSFLSISTFYFCSIILKKNDILFILCLVIFDLLSVCVF